MKHELQNRRSNCLTCNGIVIHLPRRRSMCIAEVDELVRQYGHYLRKTEKD